MTGDAVRVPPGASLYEILQVSPGASQEVIHAAYRALARGYHPDLNPSASAAKHMLELNAAFDVLSDSERRAQYDLLHSRANRKPVAVPRTESVVMRGTRPAHVARRLEQERAASPRQRALFVVLAIASVTLVLAVILWAIIGLLDEMPEASMVLPSAASAPALNHFLTVAERTLTSTGAEFSYDATTG